MVAQNTICEPRSFPEKELEDQRFDYLQLIGENLVKFLYFISEQYGTKISFPWPLLTFSARVVKHCTYIGLAK